VRNAVSDIDDIVAQLEQERNELRVLMPDASRELQDDWLELEEKTEDFVAKVRESAPDEETAEALETLGNELKQGYERIRKVLRV
jgi:hypothetical protein